MPQAKKKPEAEPTATATKPTEQALTAAAEEVLARAGERQSTDPGTELATIDPRRDDDVFRVMDAYDEQQILDELEGRPSDKMVYSFSSGGNLQTGLSYSGVAECVRTLNEKGLASIRTAKDVVPQFRELQETDEKGETITYVECLVYVEDAKNGGGDWGLARQPKFQTFKNRNRTPELDKFATTKALSKAQRNGGLVLVPMAFREILIALALRQDDRVQHLKVGMGKATADLPAPLADEKATQLADAIRAVYAEIRLVRGGPRAMPPGRFNAKLSRARATDHAAMEELLDELGSLLEHLKEQQAQAEAEEQAA